MSLLPNLENYLCQAHIDYDVIRHGFTNNAYDSACAAHLPVSNVVKAIMLKRHLADEYVIAAIPAGNKLKIGWVNKELNRDFIIAEELDLAAQFPDCVLGAVPGLAQAYNMEVIWDDQLSEQSNLYFEAGNHEELIHLSRQQFAPIFNQYAHSVISLPAESYSLYHADVMRGD